MLRTTLTFVSRGEALVTATSLAVLDSPDQDFLARHVAKLRDVTSAEDALLSRFQHGSAIPKLLGEEAEFDRDRRPPPRARHRAGAGSPHPPHSPNAASHVRCEDHHRDRPGRLPLIIGEGRVLLGDHRPQT
jgi:hypothetical protein